MFLRTSGGETSEGLLAMYEEGFDVEAVAKRLRSMFVVEQVLPFQISLMLAHLLRAEMQSAPRL